MQVFWVEDGKPLMFWRCSSTHITKQKTLKYDIGMHTKRAGLVSTPMHMLYTPNTRVMALSSMPSGLKIADTTRLSSKDTTGRGTCEGPSNGKGGEEENVECEQCRPGRDMLDKVGSAGIEAALAAPPVLCKGRGGLIFTALDV